MSLEILYEDNHLLALVKPAGLLTQPTDTDTDSLETRAKAFIKQRDHKPGAVFLHALHRLDRQASGIVLFAKTQKALSRVAAALRDQSVVKEYVALVQGEGQPPCAPLVDYLVHGDHRAEVVSPSHPDAKRSELIILAAESIGQKQWKVRIKLVTGRYHQIRAQLSAHGFPILGDSKYGSTVPYTDGAIALHHSALTLIHPTRRTELSLRSATPAEW